MLVDEVKKLEAGLLSSSKWATDKIKGGKITKIDDVYAQLIVLSAIEIINNCFK